MNKKRIPISFIPETKESAEQTYRLAYELGITYYDAAYISLTEELEGILVTENIKHLGKAKNISVISLAEYQSI